MAFTSLYLILLVFGLISTKSAFKYDGIAEDSKLSTFELVKKNGYDGEVHFVTTEDGYILRVPRIQPAQNCQRKPTPIILLHSFLSNSDSWLLQGPEKSLGYVLSDACYDVWMPNNRGNMYSRNHTTFSPNKWQFWRYSFHEMGVYDIPAIIDYILNETKSPDVFILGYSQGSLAYFIFQSLKPEYNSKVRAMIAYAPVAFLGNTENKIIKLITNCEGPIISLLFILRQKELFRPNPFIQQIISFLSRDEFPITQEIILQGLFGSTGIDRLGTNDTILPALVGHFPDGVSLKHFSHLGQLVLSGKFRMFNYGRWLNLLVYGQKAPPDYPLENIKTPLVFWHGKSDNIATEKDIEILKTKLKTSVEDFVVPWEEFNHVSFGFSTEARKLVYDPTIAYLDNH